MCLPGAVEPPWLTKYTGKQQEIYRLFGKRVVNMNGDTGLIVFAGQSGTDTRIEYKVTVTDTSNQRRGAHSSLNIKEEWRDDLLFDIQSGKYKLIDPKEDDDEFRQDANVSFPTCGPYCARCDQHVGVGPSAWTRCWNCGWNEPGSGSSIPRTRKNADTWQPSTLTTHE